MFICEPCLRANFTNEPSLMQSYGPCEWCHKTGPCSDIPSRALRNKGAALKARARVRAEAQAKDKTPLERMDDALDDDD